MSSEKRVILITGGNGGIGFDTAAKLASASPSNHIIIGARTLAKGEKTVKDIQAQNPSGTLSFLQLDVTSDESIDAAAKQIESEFGHLDILVNNAGIFATGKPMRENTRDTFETNVIGPQVLTDKVAPLLEKSSDPRVINVSSGLGSIGLRYDSTNPFYDITGDDYRMSKAALNMLTSCQSYNFRNWKNPAKVFAFCPGYVVSNLTGADETERQRRRDTGAESSETSAQGILEIVNGDRDHEANVFVQKYGKTFPW